MATRSRTSAARAAHFALTAFAALGCYQSYGEITDGNDTYASPDDARPDVHDDGALPDLGPDGDADANTCAGGWYDPTSDLCWQDPPDETLRNWGDAVAYCDGLALAGHDNWRMRFTCEQNTRCRSARSHGMLQGKTEGKGYWHGSYN